MKKNNPGLSDISGSVFILEMATVNEWKSINLAIKYIEISSGVVI